MADKNHLDLTAKQWAYCRASEILEKSRVKPILCTPEMAKTATIELRKLGKRLSESMFNMSGRIYLKKKCEQDPDFAKQVKESQETLRWARATITAGRIERKRKEEREKAMKVQLGIDGNCGFALLGEDLQNGEAEFVEFQTSPEVADTIAAKRAACDQAFKNLKTRLNMPNLHPFFGPSHPDAAEA